MVETAELLEARNSEVSGSDQPEDHQQHPKR